MQVCGNACGISFSWTSTNVPTLLQTLPHSDCVSVGWDSVVLGVQGLQLIGQVGQIASQ